MAPRKGAAERGYYDGQSDLLGCFSGEYGLEAVHRELAPEVALWILGHNLEVAGGLKHADQLAKSNALAWNARVARRYR